MVEPKKPELSTISITIGPEFAGYKDRDLTYAPSRLHLKRDHDSVRFELTGGGPFVVKFSSIGRTTTTSCPPAR